MKLKLKWVIPAVVLSVMVLSMVAMVPVFAQQTIQQTEIIHQVNSDVHIKLACISVIFFTYCW